jgi:tetratricopeptide (TPR) repeat protein
MVKKKILEAIESNDVKTKRWRQTFGAARMAYDVGEFRQAESLLARANEMSHELPERSFAENATHIGTAAVLLATGRAPAAKAQLEKTINSLGNYSDNKHEELAGVAMRFLAQALAETGDVRGAEKTLQKSVELLKRLGPDASVQYAYSLCDLCGVYLAEQRYSEAEQNITKAMLIMNNVLGPDAPEYQRADMIYAVCSPMTPETRMEVVEDNIAKMEYFFGGKHPNIARALNRYFKVLGNDSAKAADARERFGLNAPVRK